MNDQGIESASSFQNHEESLTKALKLLRNTTQTSYQSSSQQFQLSQSPVLRSNNKPSTMYSPRKDVYSFYNPNLFTSERNQTRTPPISPPVLYTTPHQINSSLPSPNSMVEKSQMSNSLNQSTTKIDSLLQKAKDEMNEARCNKEFGRRRLREDEVGTGVEKLLLSILQKDESGVKNAISDLFRGGDRRDDSIGDPKASRQNNVSGAVEEWVESEQNDLTSYENNSELPETLSAPSIEDTDQVGPPNLLNYTLSNDGMVGVETIHVNIRRLKSVDTFEEDWSIERLLKDKLSLSTEEIGTVKEQEENEKNEEQQPGLMVSSTDHKDANQEENVDVNDDPKSLKAVRDDVPPSPVIPRQVTSPNTAAESNSNESTIDEESCDASDEPLSTLSKNDCIKELYSHILPYGALPETKVVSWSGIDDLGYDVMHLTEKELSFLEMEYQKLIIAYTSGNRDNFLNKNQIQFDQDMKEANAVVKPENDERNSIFKDHNSIPKNDNEHNLNSFDSHEKDQIESVSKGDLEVFHLPIVYHALQTGFEATKDLVLEPGNLIAGQFLVEDELGSAAFSTAYKCIDLRTEPDDYHRQVCLKVIKNTKDFFDQSLDEIKILELLRRTGQCAENNVLEMLSYFYYREHLIIVTELLCLNLFDFSKYLMENNQANYFQHLNRMKWIARQILISLKFLHSMNLIHSDVKPENILLESYSRAKVKLIDFGSSCFVNDRQSSYIQSRSYRAPEVILGMPYDDKIDVWSLGCVIAEMYTSQVTFCNHNIISMLARIEAICGPFPKHMREKSKHGDKFFKKSGLLYRKVGGCTNEEAPGITDTADSEMDEEEDDCNGSIFEIYRPKLTTLSERLGFKVDLFGIANKTEEEKEQALFTDFVQTLLMVDPDARPTASEALQHPWILSGSDLVLDDVRFIPQREQDEDEEDSNIETNEDPEEDENEATN